jgi:hypothetical protein
MIFGLPLNWHYNLVPDVRTRFFVSFHKTPGMPDGENLGYKSLRVEMVNLCTKQPEIRHCPW